MSNPDAPGDAQWSLEVDGDGIAWLTFDKPGASANTLSRAVMEELDEWLTAIERASPRGLVIRSAKSRLHRRRGHQRVRRRSARRTKPCRSIRAAQAILARLEALPCPTVAAINGSASAAASSWRWPAATASASTTRSRRSACPRCSSASIRASAARCARCDCSACAGDGPDADRQDPARRQGAALRPRRPPRPGRATARGRARTRSEPAAGAIRPCCAARAVVRAGARLRRRQARAAGRAARAARALPGAVRDRRPVAPSRRESVARPSRRRRSRSRSWCARRRRATSCACSCCRTASRPWAASDLPAEAATCTSSAPASWAATSPPGARCGASRSRCRIAAMEFVAPALERARAAFEKRSRVPGQADATMRRLHGRRRRRQASPRADVVIEAIFENADAKRELYARLEPRMKPGAVLATNTSSLVLEPLAPDSPTRAGSSACISSTRWRRCRWSR